MTQTPDEKTYMENSIIEYFVENCHPFVLNNHPVVQPTDYIVLKLMAIANNPDRSQKDEGDILEVLNLYKSRLISENFESLNKKRIYLFAKKFGQKEKVQRYFDIVLGSSDKPGNIGL